MAREAKDLKMWLASIRKRRPCYGWSVAGGRELREGVAKFVCAAMMLDTVHAMPVVCLLLPAYPAINQLLHQTFKSESTDICV